MLEVEISVEKFRRIIDSFMKFASDKIFELHKNLKLTKNCLDAMSFELAGYKNQLVNIESELGNVFKSLKELIEKVI